MNENFINDFLLFQYLNSVLDAFLNVLADKRITLQLLIKIIVYNLLRELRNRF